MKDIIICALILVIALFVIYTVFTVLFYRRQKLRWGHVIEQYRLAFEDRPTLNMKERVDASTSLFAIIDTLIQYSIISDREYDVLLQKKSKKLDVDEAIKRISTSVFSWLNPSIYTDINNVVTSECIMTYIQKRTFAEYFLYLQRSNESGE